MIEKQAPSVASRAATWWQRTAQALSTVRRVLQLLVPVNRGTTARLVCWTLLEGIVTTGLPYVTMRLIESIFEAQQGGELHRSMIWLASEVGLAIALTVSGGAKGLHIQALLERAQVELSSQVLASACSAPFQKFEQEEFVNQVTRIRESTNYAAHLFVDLLNMLRAAVVFIGCSTLLFLASAWLVPFVLLSALPGYLLEVTLVRKSVALDAGQVSGNHRRWYLEWLLTSEMNAKEVRTLNAKQWFVALYRDVCGPIAEAKIALSQGYKWHGLLCSFLSLLAQYGAYVFVVVRTIGGQMTLGNMLLFVISFQTCRGALMQLLSSVAGALGKELRLRSVVDFLDHYPSLREEPEAEPISEVPPEVTIEDVWFTYPGARSPVLRGVNLTIRAGEKLAIVGANGAGKTTLIKIVLGLYPLQRGRILFNGVDVAERSLAWRQRNIGVIFQDFSRFHFSALDNISIGAVDGAKDEARVWDALDKADAADIVRELPAGLQSALGPAFGGRDLSGGQWQRVALARLFMSPGRLWVMDEPSSSMDPETEERTFRRFREWTSNRTSVIISHRSSTIVMADRIAVMHDGKVIEVGKHADLIARGGRYTQLFPGVSGESRVARVAM